MTDDRWFFENHSRTVRMRGTRYLLKFYLSSVIDNINKRRRIKKKRKEEKREKRSLQTGCLKPPNVVFEASKRSV